MEFIVTTLKDTDKQKMFDADSKNAKIKYLEFKNRQLEEENEALLAILAEALGNRVIVVRKETLKRKPYFRIEENLAGDILISRR